MRIRSACSVNKKLFFVVLMTLLLGALFSTMSVFGEDEGKCIEGNCNDGQGTYTWPDGSKYVGHGRTKRSMEKEPLHGLMAASMLGHGRMASLMVREHIHGLMAASMLECSRMASLMAREHLHCLMVASMLECSRMASGMKNDYIQNIISKDFVYIATI